MALIDQIAIAVFVFCWLGYEPFIKAITKRTGVHNDSLIAKDLSIVRSAWMREMTLREVSIFDSQILGNAINSASFFASASLILLAAVGGALFEGQVPNDIVDSLNVLHNTREVLQLKLGLILICLSRGLLNFIWALRQMNYCAAAFGAVPENMDSATADKFADALSDIIEPSMSNFSQGVRGYYFALAAGAWIFGPIPLIIATVGATTLLWWRQSRSQAARGIRKMRELLETHPYPTLPRPLQDLPDHDVK